MKINFVYHSPQQLGSGYFGSMGLKNALEANNLLEYSFDQTNDSLDVDRLQANPIFYVRGFLNGRMPIVARGGAQFKAAWQSESFYTRAGVPDSSSQAALDNQEHFNMYFTCAETDLTYYDVPTCFLPSWADTTIFDNIAPVEKKNRLGWFGGIQGREEFLNGDTRGLFERFQTKGKKYKDAVAANRELVELICKYDWLVAPPGRCFTGMCGRAWEIMACGRLCFAYYNEDTMYKTSMLFRDGVNIVFWRDIDELYAKFDYYSRHRVAANVIAHNGYELIHNCLNQNFYAQYIVDCMEKEYVKWQEEQSKISPIIEEVYASL